MGTYAWLGILCCLFLTGCAVGACDSSYDYTATIECLAEPLVPQYNGGLIRNPNFNSGSSEWGVFGSGKIQARNSSRGNTFLVAYDRNLPNDSFSHKFNLQKDLLYTFSAWLQLNRGKEIVSGFLEIPGGSRKLIVGSVIAKSGCWSMLKGGFAIDENTKAQFYVSSNNTKVEIWIDNVSLKGFTKAEWRAQLSKSIEQIRHRRLRIHVRSNGKNLPGAKITIRQIRPDFLIGCGSTEKILNNKGYQDWFTRRFQTTTFGNEMKWYYTEARSGRENYEVPDAMVSFFRKHRISIRGHNILWDNKNETPSWIGHFLPRQLLKAAVRHVGSVVSRYSGDVIAWDVMNENLHYSFFEDNLGPNASAMFYQIVRALDPSTPLFLNEYNTLENPFDMAVTPSRYVERISEIQSFPGNDNIALRIGLEGHFILRPNLPYIRAAFDVLGTTGLPIWLTELDTKRGPNQAIELEDVMREAFAHPAVEGIVVWGNWKPTGCNHACLTNKNYDVLPHGCAKMCLIDNHFKNLPSGDVVDKLLGEWRSTNLTGVTDGDGVLEQTVFLGEYSIAYDAHPLVSRSGEKVIAVAKDHDPLVLTIDL
ncbi:endo-1,4-beta-xylanase 5-like [Andrographis paniculata]|uniref:endo-1,4-beta-xylanase 5-like n=1 Tax=Andrographis paniculata TaxID=175694 RepID=UPI0021E7D40A|nr:endo-1,4-beta-xylanase 5-like [Andrographis paniculata]XP_051146918.1 endo-1,4-beta-xylanase 5-like [Andrographis paniculata]XP_051146919.1 endo-1,4-beta-xylanase 5-like [Andrographis paniculata]XP_051146920.1 endo-1,4-beta-xylanase 5-like [Andrographis paniculata]XP_051146921.1 endo-1,4-beta-xylanase 5-like [Andrographis paniculata]XP_051146922.1 endo-1,4-beta-xylanase 5-like [Andrographis paniculata]XP_051146923.1 endo-1,4-beta-xylanase 5-like [Andrographis paniculata]